VVVAPALEGSLEVSPVPLLSRGARFSATELFRMAAAAAASDPAPELATTGVADDATDASDWDNNASTTMAGSELESESLPAVDLRLLGAAEGSLEVTVVSAAEGD